MKIFNKPTLKPTKIFCSFSACIFLTSVVISSGAPVYALSQEQKNLYQKNINYYEYNVCGGEEEDADELAPGTGTPGGTTFPNLSPEAMAKGIDQYIEETNQNSKLKDLGETIVKGAQKSNINPFLIVAIAQKESVLGDPGDYNVKNGNNSFGRTATSSQPNFQGARTWYKWSTMKASVDPDAAENKDTNVGDIAEYIRNSNFYDSALKSNDLTKLMTTYAPPFENDTTQYVQDIKSWTKKMLRLTKKYGGDSGSPDSSSSIAIDGPFKSKPMPSTNVTAGYASKGTASSYGNDRKHGVVDLEDNNRPYVESATNDDPGIAVYNYKTAGGWWKVIAPNKKAAILRQTDVGPSTEKVVDINAVGARVFGYKGGNNFPTGEGTWKIEYMGKSKPPGAIEHDGETAGDAGSSEKKNDSCCLIENTTTNLAGRNNREKIWNYLVGELKLNDKQAAGVMGNMEQESGFNPTAVNPSSGAYGIAQWLGGRKTSLENFAQEKGKSKSNLGVQLEYLKKELEGSYKSSVYEPLKNANSVAESTRIWLEKFEIPCTPGTGCDAEMNTRLPMSQKWFDKYSDGGADTAPETSDDAPACPEGGSGESTGQFAWPLPKQYPVTSCYGSASRGRLHSGLDIAAPRGTPIKAADGGEVTVASAQQGFGNTVVVKHSGGLSTLYGHMKDGSIAVRVGQKVDQGQKLGEVNNTGSSFGDHLHFNIQKQSIAAYAPDGSDTKDPLKLLPKDSRTISGGDCK